MHLLRPMVEPDGILLIYTFATLALAWLICILPARDAGRSNAPNAALPSRVCREQHRALLVRRVHDQQHGGTTELMPDSAAAPGEGANLNDLGEDRLSATAIYELRPSRPSAGR